MKNCCRILGVIICFSSINPYFISSREIRHKRSHGAIFKLKTKADQSRNPNFKYFDSFHNAPRRTEEVDSDIPQPVFKKWRHRLKRNTYHLGKHAHHFRSKRKAKDLKIHTKHIRDISESIDDKVLQTLSSSDNYPIEVFNANLQRGTLEETDDALQQIRSLSQDIDKIASLQLAMMSSYSRDNRATKLNSSKLGPMQMNAFRSLLPVKMVLPRDANIPKVEISTDINNLIYTQDNTSFGISSQFNHDRILQPSHTIKKRQIDPLLNTVLQMDVVDPDIMKSILNISLQAMDKKQTLEFVGNVLKNNSIIIGSLSKNFLNQSTASETTTIIVANRDDTFSYASVLVILIIIVFISGIVAAGLSVNQGIKTTVYARNIRGSDTTKKPRGKKHNCESQAVSDESNPRVEEPTPCLKTLIRNYVVDEGLPARKEATHDVFKRAGVDDYVSVEGFKKWNQNWSESQIKIVLQNEPSTKFVHKYTSSDNMRKSNQDSETSDEKMNYNKQSLERELISGVKESSRSGTKNDLPSIVNKNSHKRKDKFFRKGNNK